MISYALKTTSTRKLIPFLDFAQNLWRPFSCTSPSIAFFCNLITHCLSLKSLALAESIHARLVKIGFNCNTFLGNRLIDLYSRLGDMGSSSQAFRDIPNKNVFTWNLMMMGYFRNGYVESACQLFDELPDRDVVSWNSMVSGCMLNGLVEHAFSVFVEMQKAGVRPNGFTYSILVSYVHSAYHGKQIHGSIIRSGLNLLNVVLCNSLIDMYGKLGLVDYAFSLFVTMEELDVVSWNSIISVFEKSGYWGLALEHFGLMRVAGFPLDQFTVSTIVTVCANLRDLENGKKVFALCIQLGFLSNPIVSSAVIDIFAKCNRLEDSVRLFEEMSHWDSTLCNSMITGYSKHGFAEDALWLFVLTLRENFIPTEFTFGSIISSASCLVPAEQGTQIHSLVIKFGSESDMIVASSLVDMYAKSGFVDDAMKIFSRMSTRDLVSWNTMIMGFARNGRGVGALQIFTELCKCGPPLDQISLAGILSACSCGGFVDEGWSIFSSMEEKYGVIRRVEHYTCMVDMLGRAGRLMEAMETIETMPYVPTTSIWGVLLGACMIHGDIQLAERVAERVMELEPHTSLPYLVLARMYATRGKWESMARVRKAMKERGVKKAIGCSWIGFRSNVFVFKANEILHHGGETMYSMLRLLAWQMLEEGYRSQPYAEIVDGGEE